MITRIAAFTWTIFVAVASLMPNEAVVKPSWFNFEHADKLSHFFSYAILVFLWSLTLKEKTSRIKAARIAFYFSIGYGVLIEILQLTLNTGRYFEFLDIIANIIGSIIGLIAFYKIIK